MFSFTNTQSRFASINLDSVLRSLWIVRHTRLSPCFCVSGRNAQGVKCAVSAQSDPDTREILEGTEGNRIFPKWWVFHLKIKYFVFSICKENEIELVTWPWNWQSPRRPNQAARRRVRVSPRWASPHKPNEKTVTLRAVLSDPREAFVDNYKEPNMVGDRG